MAARAGEDALFVYGTLLTGFPTRALLDPFAVSTEPAETKGRLYHLPKGYPALLAAPSGRVTGELVRIRDEAACLAILDPYEDCDPGDPERSLYVRERRRVRTRSGAVAEPWCYLWNPARAEELERIGREIPGGDWRTHVAGR